MFKRYRRAGGPGKSHWAMGIGAIAFGDTIAVGVAVLFLALIGADGNTRLDTPGGFRGHTGPGLAAAALGSDSRPTNQTPRQAHRSKGAEMKSESLRVHLAGYRRNQRWLRSKWILALAVGAAGSGAFTATVLATPSSGLSTTILAQSRFGSFFAQGHAFPPAWGALMAAHGDTDVYVVNNKIEPGGTTGRHSHPGPSLILVVAGQVTNYSREDRDCAGHTYTAGQGFIDSGGNDEHTLRNNGTTEAETIAVQLIPHGAPRRIDEPNPTRCPV